MKKLFYTTTVFFILTVFSHSQVSFAQSTAVQKAFLNVKDQLEELVTAKDEKRGNELSVRIETFRKVIGLSINEAQDLKIKLLAIDRENINDWRKKMVDQLNFVIRRYSESQQELEAKENILNIDSLKGLAETFKKWREENYGEVSNQIREFLLISEEEKSIFTAQKRAQKIAEDVRRLQTAKIKGTAELKNYLAKANASIEEAKTLNKKAEMAFFDNYILESDADAPSTILKSSSTSSIEIPSLEKSADAIASTTTSTSPLSAENQTPLPSIKDLIRSSLDKIKEAYQVFIEMSNLVRKLL